MRLPVSDTLEAAVDEVGRGSLLHDVVAACVILPPVEDLPDDRWKLIKDSKKLTERKRRELAGYIKDIAVAWAVGRATAEEIDRVNILKATMLAMHRALDAVSSAGHAFTKILVDGDQFDPYWPVGEGMECVDHECIKGGDGSVLAIAAASIVAKDFRDTMIKELVKDHPTLEAYGVNKNMGYGTKKHMDALRLLGPTEYHRKSFKPCSAVVSNASGQQTHTTDTPQM